MLKNLGIYGKKSLYGDSFYFMYLSDKALSGKGYKKAPYLYLYRWVMVGWINRLLVRVIYTQ